MNLAKSLKNTLQLGKESINLANDDMPMIEIASPEKNNNDFIKKIKENITTNSKQKIYFMFFINILELLY